MYAGVGAACAMQANSVVGYEAEGMFQRTLNAVDGTAAL
jgi:hypothetical protein